MARPTKRVIEGNSPSGRVTPKKGASTLGDGPNSIGSSSRYTPPSVPDLYRPSPIWVPIIMFTFLGAGLLAIILSYVEVLPGSPSGWYTIGGLGAILAGIITATQLR